MLESTRSTTGFSGLILRVLSSSKRTYHIQVLDSLEMVAEVTSVGFIAIAIPQ